MSRPWTRELQKLHSRCEREFLSEAELDRALRALVERPESPFTGLQFRVPRPASNKDVLLGKPGEGVGDERTTVDLRGDWSGVFETWRSERFDAGDTALVEPLSALLHAYFAADMRSERTPLLKFDGPAGPKFERTLRSMVGEHGGATVLYGDLDRFKIFNETHGHNRADQILAVVGGILESVATPDAIPIHRSGDEFLAICPGPPEAAVRTGRRLMRAVAEGNYGEDITRPVGLTLGGFVIAPGQEWADFGELCDRAEKAAVEQRSDEDGQPLPGEKRRGRLSLRVTNPRSAGGASHGGSDLDRALIVVKSLAAEERPFDDPWLNYVSQAVTEGLEPGGGLAALGAIVDDLTGWIAPDWCPGAAAAACARSEVPEIPRVSPLDIGFAVAHGVLRGGIAGGPACGPSAETPIKLPYRDGQACAVAIGDEVVASIGEDTSELPEEYDLGALIARADELAAEDARSQAALLVKIGHAEPSLPVSAFADVITVDDRPTAGGGLPDFWEAALARVIAATEDSPNVSFLGVTGALELGAKTVECLSSVESWGDDSDRLAAKVGVERRAVLRTADRLRSAVAICDSDEALAEALAQHLRASRELKPATARPPQPAASPQLRVQAEGVGLELRDGIRVATIAQAYPILLHILRSSDASAQVLDAAEVEMVDLMDVKVLLTEPERAAIPPFHSDASDDFERYFNATFLDKEGRFAKAMGAEQVRRVVEHVVDAMTRPVPFSTRRANIVLNHDLTKVPAPDLSPLGLVSVRIIPRLEDEVMRLYFSLTWRTVEALIGFPYSAYGSVRFARHLTDAIAADAHAKGAPPVELGQLAYIAHSLHVTTEEYGQKIALEVVRQAAG